MKHFRSTIKGEKPLHEIHEAVGTEGGEVTRVHVEKGETHVYFTGGEGKGEHVGKRLGGDAPREVREEEVTKLG